MATREKARVPAIEGWFTLGGVGDADDAGETDDGPALVGLKCLDCGTFVFPPHAVACPNPECAGTELHEVQLSRRGKVWSYTENHYAPPEPFVSRHDPFRPYTVAAVELPAEGLIVLGQVVDGVGAAGLETGGDVELVTDVLFEDDEHEYLIWKWRPVPRSDA